jgi:hypothetical protein
VTDPEFTDERDFVLRGREQMRRRFRAQDFGGMRIERDDYGRTVRSRSVLSGGRYHSLMPEMHAIEDTDSEKEWTWQSREFRNGSKDVHR